MKPQTIETRTTGKSDVIQAMRSLLTSDDELDRCCACRALGLIGDSSVVDDLVERLKDDDIDVCIDAAESLGRLGDRRAVAPLLNSLQNDPDSDVKTAVVEALGQLGGDQATDSLIDAAARAPENLEWEEDEDWDSWWDIQRHAVRALGNLGVTKAIPVLDAILDDESGQDIESDILLALSRTGIQGETRLIQRLDNGSPRDHRRIIKALGCGSTAEGLRTIGRCLGDKHEDVRAAAVEALVSRGASQYMSAIVLLLRDSSSEVRKTALDAVTQMSRTANGKLPTENLMPLLDDQSISVRTTTFNMLNQHLAINDLPQIRDTIIKSLDGPSSAIVTAACPLAGKTDDAEIIAKLLTLLNDTDQAPTVRREAALALGASTYGIENKLAILTQTLTDQERPIRLAAIQTLMMLHQLMLQQRSAENSTVAQSDAPLQIIIDALHGKTANIETHNKAHNKGNANPGSANEIAPERLTNHLETDEDEEVGQEHYVDMHSVNNNEVNAPTSTLAAIALENIEEMTNDEDALQHQQKQTDEMTISTQEAHELHEFIDLLEKQKATKKRFQIKKAIETPEIATDIRCLSALVLAQCNHQQVVKALQDSLLDSQPVIQREAIESLGHIAERAPDTPGLKETIGPVSSFLQFGNREQRLASIKTLGFIGNKTTLPVLLECLQDAQDNDAMTRIRSIEAISEILLNLGNKNNRPVIHIGKEGKVSIMTSAIKALLRLLKDKNSGVRTTAARSLTVLNRLIKQDNSIHKSTIEWLINAGFEDEGGQAREMGKALRLIDPNIAGTGLLKRLDSLQNSLQRRFAIEMLEEIFKPLATV